MSSDVYFEEITGVSNSTYDDNHKYVIGRSSKYWSILFKNGTNPIYYSFDGTEDAGVVSDLPGYLQFKSLEPWVTNVFYLRGGTGDEIVEVEARSQ
jgi:hypothetical protein